MCHQGFPYLRLGFTPSRRAERCGRSRRPYGTSPAQWRSPRISHGAVVCSARLAGVSQVMSPNFGLSTLDVQLATLH